MPPRVGLGSSQRAWAPARGWFICMLKLVGLTGGHQRMRPAPYAGHLAAHSGGREYLAGIAQTRRVERAAQQLHRVQVIRAEHTGHVLGLVHADAVLAGDRPAVADAFIKYRA